MSQSSHKLYFLNSGDIQGRILDLRSQGRKKNKKKFVNKICQKSRFYAKDWFSIQGGVRPARKNVEHDTYISGQIFV